MDAEQLVAEQIVQLFQRRTAGVWELVDARSPARAKDIAIRDGTGAPVVYARPAAA